MLTNTHQGCKEFPGNLSSLLAVISLEVAVMETGENKELGEIMKIYCPECRKEMEQNGKRKLSGLVRTLKT
jgi:hypothetical protein